MAQTSFAAAPQTAMAGNWPGNGSPTDAQAVPSQWYARCGALVGLPAIQTSEGPLPHRLEYTSDLSTAFCGVLSDQLVPFQWTATVVPTAQTSPSDVPQTAARSLEVPASTCVQAAVASAACRIVPLAPTAQICPVGDAQIPFSWLPCG